MMHMKCTRSSWNWCLGNDATNNKDISLAVKNDVSMVLWQAFSWHTFNARKAHWILQALLTAALTIQCCTASSGGEHYSQLIINMWLSMWVFFVKIWIQIEILFHFDLTRGNEFHQCREFTDHAFCADFTPITWLLLEILLSISTIFICNGREENTLSNDTPWCKKTFC